MNGLTFNELDFRRSKSNAVARMMRRGCESILPCKVPARSFALQRCAVASLREEEIVAQLHGHAARQGSKKKVSRNDATTQRKAVLWSGEMGILSQTRSVIRVSDTRKNPHSATLHVRYIR